MKMRFGKFKGMEFSSTPEWYQQWLLNQEWFTPPTQQVVVQSQSLTGWDGYSRRGQAIYDRIFERDQKELQQEDCRLGICECCDDSSYYFG